MAHNLSDRVALVTGASRGLGAAIALKLGACGARVGVNYHGSADKAGAVTAEIRSQRGQAISVRADVRDEAQVEEPGMPDQPTQAVQDYLKSIHHFGGADGFVEPNKIAEELGLSQDTMRIIRTSGLLHDVGKAKGDKAHHKDSFKMVRNLTPPLGWSARELQLAAVVARYHRGALPRPRKKSVQLLELPDRRVVLQLAGVLRLANSLDTRNGIQPHLKVGLEDKVVLVHAAGYSPFDRSAEEIAAARHLLELVLRRPVLVRRLRETAGPHPAAGSS